MAAVQYDYATVMRVRENRLILRHEPVLPFSRLPRERENLKTDRKKAYNGYLSLPAKRTIEKRLQCWFAGIFINNRENVEKGQVRPYMPVMVTVTLSDFQKHDDKFIKLHLLQEFLKALQRKKDIRFSFWKAEAQKNGNIHFHIIIDRYIDKKYVQGLWNYYQSKHGYLDRYRLKHGNINAPSTKVTGMKSELSPISYVLKYVQKGAIRSQRCMQTEAGCKRVCRAMEEIRRPIEGAVFRFSSALITLTPEAMFISPTLCDHLNRKVDEGKLRPVILEHCSILYCNKCKAYDQLTEWYRDAIDVHSRQTFERLYLGLGGIEAEIKPVQRVDKRVYIEQLKLNFGFN